MLKKETLQLIAKLTKTKVEDIEKAIKDEKEVDISIDEKITPFSEEEITMLKTNTYNEGKKAGVEMEIKEVKEKLGLQFQGKSIDGLLEAHSKKVLADAKIEPEKKVQELNEKLSNVQKTVSEYEEKLKAKDSEVKLIRRKTELSKYIPAPSEDGPALEADDIIRMMEGKGYEFTDNETGVLVIKKDGKEVVDKVSNPLPVKDVITGFMKDKKLIVEPAVPGGRGGGDKKDSGITTKLSEIKSRFAAEGKSTLGSEFKQAVDAAVKANPEFDLSN